MRSSSKALLLALSVAGTFSLASGGCLIVGTRDPCAGVVCSLGYTCSGGTCYADTSCSGVVCGACQYCSAGACYAQPLVTNGTSCDTASTLDWCGTGDFLTYCSGGQGYGATCSNYCVSIGLTTGYCGTNSNPNDHCEDACVCS